MHDENTHTDPRDNATPDDAQHETSGFDATAKPENPYAAAQAENPYVAAQAESAASEPPKTPLKIYGAPDGQDTVETYNPYGVSPSPAQASTSNTAQTYNPYGTTSSQPSSNPYETASNANPYNNTDGNAQENPYGSPSANTQSGYVYGGDTESQPIGYTPYDQVPYPAQPISSGKATASLVLGIIAILFGFIPILGVVLGIVAIVLAGSYLKSGGTAGTARAGRICGIIGIVFSIVMFIAGFAFSILALTSYTESNAAYESTQPDSSIESDGDNSLDKYLDMLDEDDESDVLGSTLPPVDVENLDTDEKAVYDITVNRLDMLKNADPSMVNTIATMAETSFSDATDGMTLEQCGVNAQELAQKMLEGFDYEITTVLVSTTDNTAMAAADIRVRDIFDVIDNFSEGIDAAQKGLGSADLPPATVGELLMNAVKTAGYEENGYLSLDLTSNGTSWEIDPDDWNEEMDYYFSLM